MGFRRRGSDFLKPFGSNIGFLGFQVSRTSSALEVSFTVNVGVQIGELVDPNSTARLSIESCHVRQRIGDLRPQTGDLWWCLTHGTNVELIATDVVEFVRRHALPLIEAYSDSGQTASAWIDGHAPGLTESERLRFLLKLLCHLGRSEELKLILAMLRAYVERAPSDFAAKQALRNAENRS